MKVLQNGSKTLVEVHFLVEKTGFVVSYRRLKLVVDEMVQSGLIEKMRDGKKVKYKIKEGQHKIWLEYPWRGEEEWASMRL
ncbi:hypothetical wHTH DNA-binding protein [Alphaspiravirus yamagawaense]|uniref:Hypothetical wHTH DNA-binding protein n=1 Tax=Alphaspiravirus yamagawaense TaxID=1157339 RepID=J7Q332_9VIRU|nr:hypothetical wHTH DNA-binding protein [Aeropyrum coil-shaped virus]CCG27868.1 hypothetical wHTH DNA-binding protein [Aeropyrum coil-shaped virus]